MNSRPEVTFELRLEGKEGAISDPREIRRLLVGKPRSVYLEQVGSSSKVVVVSGGSGLKGVVPDAIWARLAELADLGKRMRKVAESQGTREALKALAKEQEGRTARLGLSGFSFWDIDHDGKALPITACPDLRDTPWPFGDWNDEISSCYGTGAVVYYEHIWFEGEKFVINGIPAFNVTDFRDYFFNDLASSVASL